MDGSGGLQVADEISVKDYEMFPLSDVRDVHKVRSRTPCELTR